jgi:hypothetical protein
VEVVDPWDFILWLLRGFVDSVSVKLPQQASPPPPTAQEYTSLIFPKHI